MASNTIPSALINAKVYNAGKVLMGQADCELGDFEYMTESLTGLGLAGEIDMPVIGHFKSLTLKLTWNTVCPEAMELMEPKTHQLQIYASIQNWEADDGTFKPVPCRVNCLATPKKGGVGKFQVAKKMEPASEFELTFLKMSVNGKEVLEIDKINMKCSINGTDYLADVRSQLGQ